MTAATELARGLWRWTARHPDWHPGAFGAEVGSFALAAGDHLLLLDPLLPDDGDDDQAAGVLERLDALAEAADHVAILITIHYHVRSAVPLSERYDGRIWGPPKAGDKLGDTSRFTVLDPAEPGPAGAQAFAIGRPQRTERPLWLPSHDAIAFGDTIVTTPDGDLRLWAQDPPDEKRTAWYRDRFVPTLEPLRALPATRILTTHGAAILHDGATALATALDAPPWYPTG
jgi:hypothetical protein